ncbi:MAG: GNAT family N-acetyltransferase [Sulfurimonadaceae bacterium]
MNIELYFLRSSEHFIVKDLLHYAARLDESGETLNDHPYLEQYHRNYGNYNGDIGVYLFVDNKVAGGAWVRMLLNGFGHVDTNTPELAFAVLPEYRNQGLGTMIMEQLMKEVAKIYPQMSLSVRKNNPVIHLYERLGFTKVDGSEQTDSAGSISITMLKKFEEQTKKETPKPSLEEERFRKSFSF